jgi:predicted nicotinamide N-methyase
VTPAPNSSSAGGPSRPAIAAAVLESAGSAALLTWLLVAGWQLAPDPRLTALLVAAWLLPRRAALVLLPEVRPPLRRLVVGLSAVPFFVILLMAPDGLERELLLVVSGVGLAGGFHAAERAYAASVASVLAPAVWWRIGLVAGPLLASVLLLGLPQFAALVGVALLVAGWVLAGLADGGRPAAAVPAERDFEGQAAAETPAGFQPLVQPRRTTYLLAAFGIGAIVAATIAWLPQALAVAAALDEAFAGVALALIGAGTLVPAPVVRLRNRLPAALVICAVVAGTALLAAAFAIGAAYLAGFVVLPLLGALMSGHDAEQLIQLRRSGVAAISAVGRVVLAAAAGQAIGLAVVLALGSEPLGIGGPLVVVGGLGLVVAGLALATDRASLGALRHQVQQFSWDARPEPRRFQDQAPRSRAGRLAEWVRREVEPELVDVTLPVSGRRYAIARPSGEGRDALFERAKVDPERQMPYWAKVWPSGVALADIVVSRAGEVRGRQVLELGAGLGVTACAVLEEGGRIITADYSLLPLALCRLNALLNAGRAPGSICFNWRDEQQVRAVLRRHPPIGLILAADVLYEFRDIQPLIDVIERLLAPGGSLWLAEPVRSTAGRFLNLVALRGWVVDSQRIRAEWPDATNGWVNVHIIRRDPQPSQVVLRLAGSQP